MRLETKDPTFVHQRLPQELSYAPISLKKSLFQNYSLLTKEITCVNTVPKACSKRLNESPETFTLIHFVWFFPLVPKNSSIRMLMYIYNVIVSFIDVRTFARADAYIYIYYIHTHKQTHTQRYIYIKYILRMIYTILRLGIIYIYTCTHGNTHCKHTHYTL